MLDKVLDRVNEINRHRKFDDPKILIKTDDKLREDIALKNLLNCFYFTCVIKDGNKFFRKYF